MLGNPVQAGSNRFPFPGHPLGTCGSMMKQMPFTLHQVTSSYVMVMGMKKHTAIGGINQTIAV